MSTALRFSRIEPAEEPQLIATANRILTEAGTHNAAIYDQVYWNWQYKQLPTGKTIVYGVWDGPKLIGYYHVPVFRCSVNGVEKLVGNIQDVAIDTTYRGGGLFRQLAEFANKDLDGSDVDLLYTFPNGKSIHTFLKYNGFGAVSAVPTLLRPVRSSGIIRSKVNLLGIEKVVGWVVDQFVGLLANSPQAANAVIERITEVTDEVEAVFAEYATRYPNHLIRDKAWLTWRYFESVRGKHHILGLREAGKLTAVVVLKEDEMLGNPSLFIMDLAHVKGKETALLYLVDQAIKDPGVVNFKFNLVIFIGIATAIPSLKKIGFYQIPNKVNPRILNLLARSSSEMESGPLQQESNWLLTLGDWDVF